jgi:hypothetical protein
VVLLMRQDASGRKIACFCQCLHPTSSSRSLEGKAEVATANGRALQTGPTPDSSSRWETKSRQQRKRPEAYASWPVRTSLTLPLRRGILLLNSPWRNLKTCKKIVKRNCRFAELGLGDLGSFWSASGNPIRIACHHDFSSHCHVLTQSRLELGQDVMEFLALGHHSLRTEGTNPTFYICTERHDETACYTGLAGNSILKRLEETQTGP